MTQNLYKILSKKYLTNDILDMEIEFEDKAVPGQFIHILPKDEILRRPISIAGITDKSLRIIFQIRGGGTKILAQSAVGDLLDILGPLGNGFPIADERNVLLVGGGIGTPPLLPLAQHYGNRATVILGFRDENSVILESEFRETGADTVIQTGNIIELPDREFETVFTVGPLPMMKAVVKKYRNVYVSLEERMGCGVGACLVCVCKTKTGMARVCKDGPVLKSEVLDW